VTICVASSERVTASVTSGNCVAKLMIAGRRESETRSNPARRRAVGVENPCRNEFVPLSSVFVMVNCCTATTVVEAELRSASAADGRRCLSDTVKRVAMPHGRRRIASRSALFPSQAARTVLHRSHIHVECAMPDPPASSLPDQETVKLGVVVWAGSDAIVLVGVAGVDRDDASWPDRSLALGRIRSLDSWR